MDIEKKVEETALDLIKNEDVQDKMDNWLGIQKSIINGHEDTNMGWTISNYSKGDCKIIIIDIVG